MLPISERHPVVVIGAGPVGLAAAAHLTARGLPYLLLEAGGTPAAGVRGWGHVRLFSQWDQLIDQAAEKLLAPTGWHAPDAYDYPTGNDWAEGYLDPLAQALGDTIRLGTTVRAISREGIDRMTDRNRAETPFVIRTEGPTGVEWIQAAAVIDASGTTTNPGPLGASGLVATGEDDAGAFITNGAPDLADPETRARHSGHHTVVVGAGHTAMTALVALGRLAEETEGTTVTWAIRRQVTDQTFGGGADDQLAGRGALGLAASAIVAAGHIDVVSGFRTQAVRVEGDRVVLVGGDGQELPPADVVVNATGYRPDRSLTSEIRVDLDPSVEAPRRLAPLIDPNMHSCGSVPPHGEVELAHPEPNFYSVGMKSYGRAPTFLALTGYEQVRSVVAHLAGDEAAAREVHLVLPETGVCGGTGMDAEDEQGDLLQVGGCCGPRSQ